MTRTLRSLALGLSFLVPLAATTAAADLRTTLLRAGLSPEAIAASSNSSGSVAAIVAAVEGSQTYTSGALGTADQAFAAAQAEVQSLEKTVTSGQASEAEIAALAEAKTESAAAATAQASALTALFEAGIAGFSASVRATITTIRANAAQEVPIEFRTVNREEADWLRLKRLLAHERVCAKTGETPDSEAAAELATLRSDAAVAGAKIALAANLASVQSAWDSATAD